MNSHRMGQNTSNFVKFFLHWSFLTFLPAEIVDGDSHRSNYCTAQCTLMCKRVCLVSKTLASKQAQAQKLPFEEGGYVIKT